MPKGIYFRTKKCREVMSRARIGKNPWNKGKKCPQIQHSQQWKRGHIPWNKGKKIGPHTKEWKQKISLKIKGRKLTKKHRVGIGNALKGHHHSEETKIKIGFNQKGANNHQWRGGISFAPYSIHWTDTLKKSIRQRDGYTCQMCGKEPAVECHHIDYNKLNCSLRNLITLCKKCHSRTSHNRYMWIKYFKERV